VIHSSGPQWQALGGEDRDWLADQSFSLTDDLDGSPADETVSFAFEGPSYEIDLSDPHAAELRDAAVA